MPIYNVAVTAVVLVEAATADLARSGAEQHLRHVGGLELVDGETDVFESEPLTQPADLVVGPTGLVTTRTGREDPAVERGAIALDPAPWRSEHPSSLARREALREQVRRVLAAMGGR